MKPWKPFTLALGFEIGDDGMFSTEAYFIPFFDDVDFLIMDIIRNNNYG